MGWMEIHCAVSGLGEPGREESFFQLFSCSEWLFPRCPLSLVAVRPVPTSAELKHSMLSSKNQWLSHHYPKALGVLKLSFNPVSLLPGASLSCTPFLPYHTPSFLLTQIFPYTHFISSLSHPSFLPFWNKTRVFKALSRATLWGRGCPSTGRLELFPPV